MDARKISTFARLLSRCHISNDDQTSGGASSINDQVEQSAKPGSQKRHPDQNGLPISRSVFALREHKAARGQKKEQARKEAREKTNLAVSVQSVPEPSRYDAQASHVDGIASNMLLLSSGRSTSTTDGSGLPDDSKQTGVDFKTSAFARACSKRSSTEQKILKDASGIHTLLGQLHIANSERQNSRSSFWRGMERLGPVVKGLDIFIDATSPAANVGPHVAGAYTILKSVSLLAIAVCGAEEEFQEAVEPFLTHVPLIDRCNEIIGDHESPHVFEALVKVYADLLSFYFECSDILGSQHPNTMVAFTAKYRLSEIASSFARNTELLCKHVNVETHAMVKRWGDQRNDDFVRQLLGYQLAGEIKIHNELKECDNEACKWINLEPSFGDWLDTSSSTYWISMLGSMGCGKSTTTSYVAELVWERFRSTTGIVLTHFCRDDNETSDIQKIYVGLLLQLLHQVERLKWAFRNWYDNMKGNSPGSTDPTHFPQGLSSLLQELIGSVKQPVFVIIDGMDECSMKSRADLLTLLKQLHHAQKRLKVFISCRPDEDVRRLTPGDTTTIQFRTTRDRDRLIANYQVSRIMCGRLARDVEEFVITELSEKADGSAIWIRMLVEYIASKGSTKLAIVRRDLQSSSPKCLSDLYVKLFDRATKGDSTKQRTLAHILDTIAGSLRPLTIAEVSWAVAMDVRGPAKFSTLADLEDYVDPDGTLLLATSFISTSGATHIKDASVHLVHQSLKEMILQASPHHWVSDTVGKSIANNSRKAALNGNMLRRCIDYLLLEEFNQLDLLPPTQADVDELNSLAYMFTENLWDESPVLEPGFSYDPEERGFGGFFRYAACHWLSHLNDASQDNYLPDRRDLETLCSPQSARLKNWVEQYKRPSCSYAEYDISESNLNPIAVVARFGTSAALVHLLRETAVDDEAAVLFRKSGWSTLENILAAGNVSNLKVLITHPTTRASLLDPAIFGVILTCWGKYWKHDDPNYGDWTEIFEFLISEMTIELEKCANEALCSASQHGCLFLVKRLFAAASCNEKMLEAMLKAPQRTWGWHQSVGEAAFWGHTDTVEWLCQQSGIDKHLRYCNKENENVIHLAARQGHADCLRVLIKYFPEGVNHMSNGGTPLAQLVFDAGSNDRTSAAEVLLTLGGADALLATDNDPFYGPLQVAARETNEKMCRALILLGSACPWDLIAVSTTGQVHLRHSVNSPDRAPQLLRMICGLVPIAALT